MTAWFHPEAEAEHLETIAFYENRQAGLGAEYLTEFEQMLEQIRTHPHRYPIIHDPDIRRARMPRFPFAILYRAGDDRIEVLAVAHHRRRPSYWKSRIK